VTTSLSLILLAEFDAPIERVWQLWADPRLLERWWGPPTHPATVEKYDLSGGCEVTYVMTGPGGEKSRGWWRVMSVNPRFIYQSREHMEQFERWGQFEVLPQSVGQMDALLAADIRPGHPRMAARRTR
jgi:uncharacterized protein YndB with AHSA1/START domain